MNRRLKPPQQIVRKLRHADRLLAEGDQVPEVAKRLESARPDTPLPIQPSPPAR